MGTTTQQIETHIEQTRESLGSNLDELEQKVRAATDWKHHFRTRPMTLLSLAFGGGVVLSAVIGGRTNRTKTRLLSESTTGADPAAESIRRDEAEARQTWRNVKGAIVAVATTRLLKYAGEAFLGFDRKSEPIDKTSRVISPEGT